MKQGDLQTTLNTLTTTSQKLNNNVVSIKKYITLLITWVSLLVSFWSYLPDLFKSLGILAIILSLVECFTGIKPITMANITDTVTQILNNVKQTLPDEISKSAVDLCQLGLKTFTDLYLKFNKINIPK